MDPAPFNDSLIDSPLDQIQFSIVPVGSGAPLDSNPSFMLNNEDDPIPRPRGSLRAHIVFTPIIPCDCGNYTIDTLVLAGRNWSDHAPSHIEVGTYATLEYNGKTITISRDHNLTELVDDPEIDDVTIYAPSFFKITSSGSFTTYSAKDSICEPLGNMARYILLNEAPQEQLPIPPPTESPPGDDPSEIDNQIYRIEAQLEEMGFQLSGRTRQMVESGMTNIEEIVAVLLQQDQSENLMRRLRDHFVIQFS